MAKERIDERFLGRKFHQIKLPDGGRVISLYRWDNNDPELSLHDVNHNIFRLDKNGNVVWQIQREENGHFFWDIAHQLAREKGLDGARRPFSEIRLFNDKNEWLQDLDTWHPGLKLVAICHGVYEIDIDKGIAKNVTPIPWRDW